jgi:phosphotransferase system, enzyme I, PtsP
MMEVPALIWQLDELFKEVDFVSIGSNDLMQFLYATDRGHPILAGRYDTLSPAFLRVLSELASKAKAANVPLTLCGEMAGRPIEAMALLGVGLTSISMNPAAIGPVKAMLRELDLANLKEFITPLLKTGSDSLRGALSRYAAQHSVPL